jgi:hypothetical protein
MLLMIIIILGCTLGFGIYAYKTRTFYPIAETILGSIAGFMIGFCLTTIICFAVGSYVTHRAEQTEPISVGTYELVNAEDGYVTLNDLSGDYTFYYKTENGCSVEVESDQLCTSIITDTETPYVVITKSKANGSRYDNLFYNPMRKKYEVHIPKEG